MKNFLPVRAYVRIQRAIHPRAIGILTAAQRIVNRYYVLCEAVVCPRCGLTFAASALTLAHRL